MTEALTTKKSVTPWLRYQRDWMNDESPLKLAEKSRRVGFTYVEAFDAASRRFRRTQPRNMDYWFSSADESAAAEFIEYCRFFAKKMFSRLADYFTEQVEDPRTERFGTAFSIRCPNDARITAMSSNPRRFRSKGGDVGLDEYAYHDEARALYKAAQPATTRGGWMRVFSTHNGEDSQFNRFVKQARKVLTSIGLDPDRPPVALDYDRIRQAARALKIMPWKLHRVTLTDAVADGLVENINRFQGTAFTCEEFVENCRAACVDEDMWLQEYMCVASVELAALLTYLTIERCEHDDCPQPGDPLTGYTGQPAFVGVDVGRERHKTAIWVVEPHGDVLWTRQIRAIEKTPLPEQQRILGEILRSIRLGKCCIDSTGIGLGLAEYTQREFGGLRIEGVPFTNPSKHAMAIGTQQRYEDRGIRIPADDPALRDALHKVRKMVTTGGQITYDAPSDQHGHADEFWACALAIRAAGEGETGWLGEVVSAGTNQWSGSSRRDAEAQREKWEGGNAAPKASPARGLAPARSRRNRRLRAMAGV